jgi:hypothetical protein
MPKPINFKLQNGLTATLYPTGSSEIEHLLNNCKNWGRLHRKPGETTVVKIDVEGETVCLAYRTKCHPNNEIVDELSRDLTQTLMADFFIIYEDHLTHRYTRSHHTLVKAILQRVKPSLAPLII